jgi:hypothetical protein
MLDEHFIGAHEKHSIHVSLGFTSFCYSHLQQFWISIIFVMELSKVEDYDLLCVPLQPPPHRHEHWIKFTKTLGNDSQTSLKNWLFVN